MVNVLSLPGPNGVGNPQILWGTSHHQPGGQMEKPPTLKSAIIMSPSSQDAALVLGQNYGK